MLAKSFEWAANGTTIGLSEVPAGNWYASAATAAIEQGGQKLLPCSIGS